MTAPDEGFSIEFTGQAVLVVDLKGFDPMSFRIDDMDLTKALVRVLLEHGLADFPIGTQTKAETKRLRRILDTPPSAP